MLKKLHRKQMMNPEKIISPQHIRCVVAGLIALGVASCSLSDVPPQRPIDTGIKSIERTITKLESGDDGFEYSAWLGGPGGEVWYSRKAQTIMPAASAIKTVILIEFFSEKAGVLDEPFIELNALLDNPDAKATAHFSPEKRKAARTELRDLTPRQLAEAMLHKEHIESNAAYNAAANVIIEYLGGPQALSERIHRRFPQAQNLTIARYMLADRQKNDENLLSAHALAMVLTALANASPSDKLGTEVRAVMWLETDDIRGEHYYKGGSLSSMPQVRIKAGWWEKDCTASVYVVIAVNPLKAGNVPNYDKLRANLTQLSKQVQDIGIDIRNTKPAGQAKQGGCSHAQ